MNDAVVWNPGQYLKFEDERTRPGRDLLAQIEREVPGKVVDVGCGPGNSTELLIARWPDADVSGLDTSETMLAEARMRLPKARFERGDAATWLPERGTGVVFANAVYQWIPGHKEQFARIARGVGARRGAGRADAGQPDAAAPRADARGRGAAGIRQEARRCAARSAAEGRCVLRRTGAPRPAGRHLAHGLQPRDG